MHSTAMYVVFPCSPSNVSSISRYHLFLSEALNWVSSARSFSSPGCSMFHLFYTVIAFIQGLGESRYDNSSLVLENDCTQSKMPGAQRHCSGCKPSMTIDPGARRRPDDQIGATLQYHEACCMLMMHIQTGIAESHALVNGTHDRTVQSLH